MVGKFIRKKHKKIQNQLMKKLRDQADSPQPLPKEGQRLVKRVWCHNSGMYWIMRITTTGKQPVMEEYYCHRTSPVSVTVTKMEPNRTTQYLCWHGIYRSCGCDAFKHSKGEQPTCKHVEGILALIEADKKETK